MKIRQGRVGPKIARRRAVPRRRGVRLLVAGALTAAALLAHAGAANAASSNGWSGFIRHIHFSSNHVPGQDFQSTEILTVHFYGGQEPVLYEGRVLSLNIASSPGLTDCVATTTVDWSQPLTPALDAGVTPPPGPPGTAGPYGLFTQSEFVHDTIRTFEYSGTAGYPYFCRVGTETSLPENEQLSGGFVDDVAPDGWTTLSGNKVTVDTVTATGGDRDTWIWSVTNLADDDHDGVPNTTDNCPSLPNPDQLPTDCSGATGAAGPQGPTGPAVRRALRVKPGRAALRARLGRRA